MYTTDNGKFVIDAILGEGEGEPELYYRNLDEDAPSGLNRLQILALGYKTFISVPVVARGIVYGMLTVDAPLPDDLEERDVNVMNGSKPCLRTTTAPCSGPGSARGGDRGVGVAARLLFDVPASWLPV